MNKNAMLFGDEERIRAGRAQMRIFASNQYLYWRVAAVKSIRKIILNADDFYNDMMDEISAVQASDVSGNAQPDIVNNQIRNGWLFEAVLQAEQGIEDIFSPLMNSKDIAYFAKNVVVYPAGKIKNYIWHFDTDNIEHIMQEFILPYFPLDEPWDNQFVYKEYKAAVLLIQGYLKGLIAFHKKYYLDYCQYKHGMSEALRPFGKERTKNDVDIDEVYTMVEMARAHDLNIYKYLCYLPDRLPDTPMTNEVMAKLVPWDPEVKARCFGAL